MSERQVRLLCLVALAALATAMYAPNLDDYFQGDDFDLIHSFFDKPPGYFFALLYNDEAGSVWDYLCYEPGSVCPDPEHHGFLRPFKIWLFKLDYELWGNHAIGYHVTSTLFFLVNVLCVFAILERLLAGRRALAFLGAATVAVHPIFSGVVPSITYREEIIASAMALAAVWLFLRHRGAGGAAWPAWLCYALALLTKESGIVTIGLFAGYDFAEWLVRGGGRDRLLKRLRFYLPAIPLLAVYFALRLVAFRNFVGGHGETDLLSWTGLVDFHTTLFAFLFSRGMLTFGGVPGFGILALLILTATLFAVWLRRRRLDTDHAVHLLYAGPLWYLATTGISHGIYFSPRHVLMPVIGLVLFGVVLLAALMPHHPRRDGIAAAVLLAVAMIAFMPPTRRMSLAFSRASDQVHATLLDIERETAQLPDGSRVLVLNLPEQRVVPPPYFGHALQSALMRPFSPTDLARRLTVETRPTPGEYDLVLRF